MPRQIGNGEPHVEIAIGDGPQIRYISGRCLHFETMVGDRLMGRYWSASGRIPNNGWDLRGDREAFQLTVDGRPVSGGWTWSSATEIAESGCTTRHSVINLVNESRQLAVAAHTKLDGAPVFVRWLEITNLSAKPMALNAVVPWAGRIWQGQEYSIGRFTDHRWAMEGSFEWTRMTEREFRIQADKGLRKHNAPLLVLRNDTRGEYFLCHLAWTGNYEFAMEKDRYGLSMSLAPATWLYPQRVLAPGETVTTPAVHLAHVSGDLDDAVQAMHTHLRRSVLPPVSPEREHRIQLLVPADQGYHNVFDEAAARKCIELSAAIGVELFILDFGWTDICCDWEPSPSRFPNGLDPIIDYVHEKGMMFGLYFEPEGGRGNVQDSRAFREHPDWFWPGDILNLSIPEAAEWMEAEICRCIEAYQIDLYRIDFNPLHTLEGPVGEHHGIMENAHWRYCEALYGIFERVRGRYPHVVLQQAAMGGGRNDLGIAIRFHEDYLTDGLWIPRLFEAFSGTTLGLPPERIGVAYGACASAHPEAPHSMETALRISYALSYPHLFSGWIAPAAEDLTAEQIGLFERYTRIFKEFIRPLLPTCRLFHHEPFSARSSGNGRQWFALEYGTPDRLKGWAVIARLTGVIEAPGASSPDQDVYVLRPRGLDPGRTYRVTLDSLDTTLVADGLRLLQGIPIRLESSGESELLLFEALPD